MLENPYMESHVSDLLVLLHPSRAHKEHPKNTEEFFVVQKGLYSPTEPLEP